MHLQRPRTLLRLHSPLAFAGIRENSGYIVARFSGPPALTVPDRTGVGELFYSGARAFRGGFEITTHAQPIFHLDTYLPDRVEVLRAAVNARACAFEYSDKGLYAEGVLALAEGQPDIFLRSRVTDIISALTTRRSRSIVREFKALLGNRVGSQAIEEAAAELATRTKQTDSSLRALASKVTGAAGEIGGALVDLVSAGLVLRGLRVECSRCGSSSFIELTGASSVAMCPACKSTAAYGVSERGEPELFYRLNALVDMASDNGLLGHLATKAALLRRDPGAFLVLGANLSGKVPRGRAEVDILGLMGADLVAGEVKTSSASYTRRQLQRDVELSSSVGADVHVLAALDVLAPDLVSEAEELCAKKDLRLVALGRAELMSG